MLDLLQIDFGGFPVWANCLIVVVTIVVIGKGAHWLVESAAQLAKHFGVSELIIGLTIVALGTSAPEFAVTLIAAYNGQGDISVGNVVGSNIFNLGFILGGAAMFRAIPISRPLLIRDGTVLILTSALLCGLIGLDLALDRHDGIILLALLLAYVGLLFWQRKPPAGSDEVLAEAPKRALWLDVVLLVVGFASIGVGSRYLIGAASAVARHYNVSDWVIGVTIVAAGTSAPEFATTLAGVMKHRYDISAGNLVGSDIFNLLGVLGLAGTLQPVGIDPLARYSLVALLGMVAIALLFMRTGWRVSRLEGAVLFLTASARWGFDFATHLPP